MAEQTDPTELCGQLARGEHASAPQLLELVYNDLRGGAERLMRGERADHTLSPTALVHETYMRLVDQSRVDWKGRTHFLAVASMAMRRLLKEHARNRRRLKRGGGWARVTLSDAAAPEFSEVDHVALSDCLERLGELDPRKAEVVTFKFFGSLEDEEIAAVLGVTTRTIGRDWAFAKAWLATELRNTAC